MSAPLISILTPCYNADGWVHRLLDSILAQDYPSLEMYAIDDGSTDHTRQVIQSYVSRFQQKGYALEYVYQAHAGQSEAINKGLKRVRGKYLVWPDSDDRYAATDALSLLAAALEGSGEEVSMVRCLPFYTDESGTPWQGYRLGSFDKEDLFEDFLFWRNGFWCLSGGYMVKMDLLDRYIPGRAISTALHAGQNFQLMLPLLYGHKCLTVQKCLYQVFVRKNSHSRGQYQTSAELLRKNEDFEHVLVQTLENMEHIPEKKRWEYIRRVRWDYLKKNLKLGWQMHAPWIWIKIILREAYAQLKR